MLPLGVRVKLRVSGSRARFYPTMARIYFETSAWNALNRHANRDRLIQVLSDSGDEVLASVITAGEILRTGNEDKRKALCDAMSRIHGSVRPLLDRPHELAEYAARAVLAGEETVEIRESSAAALIRSFLEDPESVKPDDRQLVSAWICSLDEDYLEVMESLKNTGPREGPKFCTPDVLEDAGFNRLFMEKVPLIGRLELTEEQLAEVAARTDIWKAYRGAFAFTVDAGIDKMPATRPGNKHPQKRPGGPDVLQATYLGTCDTFIVDDVWLRESIAGIAAATGLQRRILPSEVFFNELLSALSWHRYLLRATAHP